MSNWTYSIVRKPWGSKYKYYAISNNNKRKISNMYGMANTILKMIDDNKSPFDIYESCTNREEVENWAREDKEARAKAKKEEIERAEATVKEFDKNSKRSHFVVGRKYYNKDVPNFVYVCTKRTPKYINFDVCNGDEFLWKERSLLSNHHYHEYVSFSVGGVSSEDCEEVKQQRKEECKKLLEAIECGEICEGYGRHGDRFLVKVARTEYSRHYFLLVGYSHFNGKDELKLLTEEAFNRFAENNESKYLSANEAEELKKYVLDVKIITV